MMTKYANKKPIGVALLKYGEAEISLPIYTLDINEFKSFAVIKMAQYMFPKLCMNPSQLGLFNIMNICVMNGGKNIEIKTNQDLEAVYLYFDGKLEVQIVDN